MDIRKAVINFVNNTLKMQTAQVEGLSGEIANDVDRYQNYGFNSIPKSIETDGRGAECVLVDVGSTDQRIIIATDDRRYRPTTGLPGDVMIYGPTDTPYAEHIDATQRIVLQQDGTILIKRGTTKIALKPDNSVDIQATTINILANVNITGTVTANGHRIDDTHRHSSVQPGSGTSGTVT